MKFNSLFYGLILISLVLSSCEKDKIIENEESPAESKLVLSSDNLVFTDNETKELFISTEPSSEFKFEIIESPDWVEVTPRSGKINQNSEVKISITSNFENLNPGDYNDELIIQSDSGINTILLKGTFNEKFSYSIPESISFPFYKKNEQILIQNNGNIKIDYALRLGDSNIEGSPLEGEILPGEYTTVSVKINEGALTSSEIYAFINGIEDTIAINVGKFEEGMFYLSEKPIDAEYSKNTDQLVYVTENSSLYTFDPLLNKTERLILPFSPTCISLSPDGYTAVIGHDSYITYADINANKIIGTYQTSCKAADVILGKNGWAYVFPENKEDYVEARISCLNLNVLNPEEKLHIGSAIRENQRAKLHPSGDFIYLTTTRTNPLSIIQFDIKEGVANYLNSSRNDDRNDNYIDDGNLWISEDGNHIFTKDRDIIKTSENQEQAVEFIGTLNLKDYTTNEYPLIQGLDHSINNNNLYVIITGMGNWEYHQDPNLLIYNSDSMSFKNKISLNKHYVKNYMDEFELSNAKPLFVFSSSTGSEAYVITEGFHSSNSEYKWAIQTIDIE